jgi:3-oxoacyl-[acyl-carrier-protein] synthase-3
MAFLRFENVKVAGLASAVPKKVKEIREMLYYEPGEAEKVIALTHIERARMVSGGMLCSDLCYSAADKLLDELQWDRDDIEVLIFVSLARDYVTPATSALLQDKLRLPKSCYCIDVPLACSGYVYGLSVIASLMSSGLLKRGLLLVGETTTHWQSPEDKTMWSLHGDAGTATALEYVENSGSMVFNFGTDGSRYEAIINPDGGVRNPINENSYKMEDFGPGIRRRRVDTILDGMNVFTFSITEPPKSIKEMCEKFNINMDNIDYLVLHQANKYMDDKIGKKLRVPPVKIPFSLMQYGNTSSASIPLTITTGIGRENVEGKHLKMIMSGFGAGLSWGCVYLLFDNVVCPDLIELETNDE